MHERIIFGIDLAGSEKRRTGICEVCGKRIKVFSVFHDDEILSLVPKKPCYIGIDAPLSLPMGRESIESPGPHFRQCDLELRRRGIKFFPITLGGMRALTKRGMELKKKIEMMNQKAEVFEVFPGALYDFLQMPRKMKNEREKKLFLKKVIKIVKLEFEQIQVESLNQDELDAIACAVQVIMFLEGKAELIGDKKEGLMIVPILSNVRNFL